MTTIPPLTEWSPSAPLRLTSAQRRALEKHFDATVTSGPDEETFVVTPGSVVGTVIVDDFPIVVRPKVAADRVLFMVAYSNDPLGWKDDWAQLSGSNELVDGVAALFVAACDKTLAQGLYRHYRHVEADARSVRGRIRWERQARRLTPLPIAVRHSVHDDNVVENQVVRAALAVLRDSRLSDPHVASGIARLWRQFRDLDRLSDPLHHLDRIGWTRQNEHYRPLIRLTRLVLQNSMADLGAGNLATRGFTLSLPQVFEQFVRTALREQWELSDDELPDLPSRHLRLDEAGRVGLEPDLGVRINHRWAFVGDVKYKRDSGLGRQADLYQLLAYVTATSLNQGTLIYAEGPPTASTHRIRKTGAELHVVRLDLTKTPPEVLEDLSRVSLSESRAFAPIRSAATT